MMPTRKPVEPQLATAALYNDLYALYSSLYPALRPAFAALNALPDAPVGDPA
jgi:hypothetical protein